MDDGEKTDCDAAVVEEGVSFGVNQDDSQTETGGSAEPGDSISDENVSSSSNAGAGIRVFHANKRMACRRRAAVNSSKDGSASVECLPGHGAKSRPLSGHRRVHKGYLQSGNFRAISRSPAVFTKIRDFKVNFTLPNETVIPMGCSGDYTVAQIKQQLWSIMQDIGILDEDPSLEDKDLYSLKYEKEYDTYELIEEQQIFQTLSIVSYWRAKNAGRGEFKIVPRKVETVEEKIMNKTISRLIGFSLYQLCSSSNDEVNTVRRLFVGVRRSAVSSRDPSLYSMEPELTPGELPSHIESELQTGNRIIVKIYSGTTFTTTSVPIGYTAFQVLNDYFPQDPLKRERVNLPRESNLISYILKVCGRNIYLVGPDHIIDFAHVRRCIANHQSIQLAVVEQLDTELDRPRQIPEPDLVDDNTGLVGSYKQLSSLTKDHTQVFSMAMWDIRNRFRVRIDGVDELDGTMPYKSVFVEVGLFHGGKPLTPMVATKEVPFARSVCWGQRLVLDIKSKDVPKEARLCCYVYARRADQHRVKKSESNMLTSAIAGGIPLRPEILNSGSGTVVLLHWVNMQIVNYRSILKVGKVRLPLWKVPTNNNESWSFHVASPIGSTALSSGDTVLHIELDSYAHPVAYPNSDIGWGVADGRDDEEIEFPVSKYGESRFSSAVDHILSADPLKELDGHECELLWRLRWNLTSKPEALPRLLQTVDWGNLEKVIEVHNLLVKWKEHGITLEVALQLLDSRYADSDVRELAVERLEELSNDDLLLYFLQLVQVLKFEPYDDSHLARFLLRRALRSKRIGHCFFWFLRSEMDTSKFQERFALLLEAYLKGCGEAMLAELEKQHNAFHSFAGIAAKLRTVDKKDRPAYLTSALSALRLPQAFSSAFDPSLRIGRLHIHRCRSMDSKKMPLWLEFENVDPTCANSEPVRIIFKAGDDLRQDMLTLQMLRLMDKLWQEEGLNLHMIPYGCMSTGFEVGMIEVVPHAATVAKIQRDYGGSLGALKDDCLYNWLKQKNSRSIDFEDAVERFVLSCAGYCVATFVLGIGDRHNDNIMLTDSGCLFHIDFGHFLGNTKTFMGFKRERAPFVLTPDFVAIMGKKGSPTFQRFQETCCRAYNAIRRRSSLFINLFAMMKHTGIPELASIEDIEYLRSVLVLDKTEEEAEKYFKEKIDACLRLSWSTQLNWMAHNVVHS